MTLRGRLRCLGGAVAAALLAPAAIWAHRSETVPFLGWSATGVAAALLWGAIAAAVTSRGGTYRCIGRRQPVLGLHLQDCRPLLPGA